jgi:hypothetical protein
MVMVKDITSDNEFDQEVLSGLSAVAFKPGSGYELEKSWYNLAEMYPKVKFFEVDVDEQPAIADRGQIDRKNVSVTGVPMIQFYHDGGLIESILGDDLQVIGAFLNNWS